VAQPGSNGISLLLARRIGSALKVGGARFNSLLAFVHDRSRQDRGAHVDG
jgi:hypothetical protein